MHTKTELGLFKSTEIKSAKQLEAVLSETVLSVVAYRPYLEQRNLQNLFTKENKNATDLITQYVSQCDVNVSNNLGMTLLHTLLWAERPDLATMVVESPQFNKINYKFSIPAGMDVMYASALDLAMGLFLESSIIDLSFIELLLKNGASLPNPTKKFLNGEFTAAFYPHMVFEAPEAKSKEELTNLFCLLHRYGFSISGVEEYLTKRLFNTENPSDNRAEELKDKLSIDEQKTRFTAFFNNLKQKCEHIPVDGKAVVELTTERLDNGEATLRLPFDPLDRPCSLM